MIDAETLERAGCAIFQCELEQRGNPDRVGLRRIALRTGLRSDIEGPPGKFGKMTGHAIWPMPKRL
jgi:hypothetical protein